MNKNTNRWAASLPALDGKSADPRWYGECALGHLANALLDEREGSADDLLHEVRWAAAHVRAWRLALPKGEQEKRVADTGWQGPNRALIIDAIRCLISADESPSYPARYLRVTEADLRTIGKRLMVEGVR